MLTIVTCEDLLSDRENMRSVVGSIARTNELDISLRQYATGEQLLLNYQRGEVDLVFLDVLLGEGMTGVETARALREKDADVPLVFLTSSPDYALDGFDVRAIHYLIKPITEEKLKEALMRCEEALQQARRTIEVTVDRSTERVLVQDILFAEVLGNRTTLHLTNGAKLTTYLPLADICEQAGPSFLRCHRSFLVNMNHILRIEGREFLLANNETVPIRINGRADVLEQYLHYLSQD